MNKKLRQIGKGIQETGKSVSRKFMKNTVIHRNIAHLRKSEYNSHIEHLKDSQLFQAFLMFYNEGHHKTYDDDEAGFILFLDTEYKQRTQFTDFE